LNKLFGTITLSILIGAISFTAPLTLGETMQADKFEADPQQRWIYISDQVMGGVSQGQLQFEQQGDEEYARMTGRVSTENNGGFIQFRKKIEKGATESALGVYLRVRGNSEGYFVHLRTAGTLLPWQYYQASFKPTDDWQVIKLPLTDFAKSSSWLRSTVKADAIRSIAVVAFGKDYEAEIDVAEIGFYD
jgi:hypothetical protein